MRIDFARLNHILIPKTKDDRDRFRESVIGRAFLPLFGFWGSFTDEGRMLLVVAPVVGALAIDVLRTRAYLVFCILVGLLLGSFVASRSLKLVRTTVRITAPRRVTIGEEVTFTVTCHRESAGETSIPVRIRGPFLTWDGTWTGPPPDELLVAPEGHAAATMRARFVARGLHHLDPFTAARVAPLGLACGPRTSSDGTKVFVVPRIANVVRLPMASRAKHHPGGVSLASKAGESMELVGVRPYRPGDPVRDLHARTWARTGKPAIREYQQEYFTRVGVALDTSTGDPDLLESAIELTAGVIAYLSHSDSLIDVLVVGQTVHELVLGRSLGRLDQALELLSATEGKRALDTDRILPRLEPHLDEISSMILIAPVGGDDGERSRLEARLRARGLTVTTLVVDAELATSIRAKEPLGW